MGQSIVGCSLTEIADIIRSVNYTHGITLSGREAEYLMDLLEDVAREFKNLKDEVEKLGYNS